MQQEVLLDKLWQLVGEASKAASGADADPARLLCSVSPSVQPGENLQKGFPELDSERHPNAMLAGRCGLFC